MEIKYKSFLMGTVLGVIAGGIVVNEFIKYRISKQYKTNLENFVTGDQPYLPSMNLRKTEVKEC